MRLCVCLYVWFAGQLLCDPVCDTRSRPAGRQGCGGLHRTSRGDFCKWSNGWIILSNSEAFLAKHICTITVNYTQDSRRHTSGFHCAIETGMIIVFETDQDPLRELNCPFEWFGAHQLVVDVGRVCCSYGSRRLFLLYSCAQEQSPLILQTSACRLIGGIWDVFQWSWWCLVPWHLTQPCIQLIGFLTRFQPV